MSPFSPDVMSRFFAKTTTDHDLWFEGTKCVIWTASAGTRNGYGRFWDGDKPRRCWVAHRFAYVAEHGEVPDGLELDHRCERKKCVNHLHLEATTGEVNRHRWQVQQPISLTCANGHLWTFDNIRHDGRGQRVCRRCRNASVKRCNAASRQRRRMIGLDAARERISREVRTDGSDRRRKLTPEQVDAIRRDKRSAPVVAAEYGVHQQHILKIRRGESWAPWTRDKAAR